MASNAGLLRRDDVRMLRRLRGRMSQAKLGFLANLSQTEVSKAERGFASFRTLRKQAEVLGVADPSELTRVVGEPALTVEDVPEVMVP